MSLSSGVLPYRYTSPYPFKITADNPTILYSGIIFEECMWVHRAELRRFRPNDNNLVEFQLYQHQDGLPGLGDYDPPTGARTNYKFEPTTNGRILANSGQIHATEWITDLRASLSGVTGKNSVFSVHAFDAGVNEDVFRGSWLRAKIGGHLNNLSRITTTRFRFGPSPLGWGPSGSFYDLDINEVQFQPVPRFRGELSRTFPGAAGSPVGASTATISVVSPVFPNFAKTDGSLVSLFTEDQLVNESFGDLSYRHIGSGYLRWDGDMLFDNGKYEFGANTFGTFIVHGFRRTNGSLIATVPGTRCFIDPPAKNYGSYILRTYNTNFFPPSGEVISEYDSFQYFNDCFAQRTQNHRISPGSASGGYVLLSPIDGRKLFVHWEPNHPPELNGNSTIIPAVSIQVVHRTSSSNIRGFRGYADIGSGPKANFRDYDNTFNNTSIFGHSLVISNPDTSDFTLDGSLYIVLYGTENVINQTGESLIAKVTEGDYVNSDCWRFDTTLGNTISYESRDHMNIFVDGNVWVSCVANATDWNSSVRPYGFAVVNFGTLTSNVGVFTLGDFYALDANDFGYDTIHNIKSIEKVTNGTHVTNGIWCFFLAENSSDPGTVDLLGRIEQQGTVWKVIELYPAAGEANFTFHMVL